MSFADQLANGTFSILVELDPPKGTDLAEFLESALKLRGHAEAVIVSDAEHAIMRMAPLAPCLALIERNVETILTVNGRDRNRLSFQGDLLSAWTLGVRNVVLKLGQDAAVGDQPLARSSGDLDLDLMVQCAAALNRGQDLAGEPLQGKTDYLLGAALDVTDDPEANRQLAQSLPRLAERGVRFVTLGPTYDSGVLDQFAPAAAKSGIKLFASVMLLKSVAMIRYLNQMPRVPAVPQKYLKRMIDSPVKLQAGLEIAADFMKDVEERCQGAVLLAMGWGGKLTELFDLRRH